MRKWQNLIVIDLQPGTIALAPFGQRASARQQVVHCIVGSVELGFISPDRLNIKCFPHLRPVVDHRSGNNLPGHTQGASLGSKIRPPERWFECVDRGLKPFNGFVWRRMGGLVPDLVRPMVTVDKTFDVITKAEAGDQIAAAHAVNFAHGRALRLCYRVIALQSTSDRMLEWPAQFRGNVCPFIARSIQKCVSCHL